MINPVTFIQGEVMIPAPIYYGEVFKYVRLDAKGEIILYDYAVSTYGRVYSFKMNKFLRTSHNESKYVQVTFSCNGKHITKRLNRIVMLAFNPIPNAEQFQVNHEDGNKDNNCLWNLFWNTAKENIGHAFATGLHPVGEVHPDAIITNEQAHMICKGLEAGMEYYDIYLMLNTSYPFEVIRKIMYKIRYKECWVHISKLYNISENKQRFTHYTEEQIHYICKALSEGKSYNQICDDLCIYDSHDRSLFKRMARDVANGESYVEISSQYSFEKPKGLRDSIFTNEQIHFICKSIANGITDSKMLFDMMNINISSMDSANRTKHFRALNSIKTKKSFREISDLYF